VDNSSSMYDIRSNIPTVALSLFSKMFEHYNLNMKRGVKTIYYDVKESVRLFKDGGSARCSAKIGSAKITTLIYMCYYLFIIYLARTYFFLESMKKIAHYLIVHSLYRR